MQTYIYYRMDCISDGELSSAKEYFAAMGMDIQADGMHLLITSDESKRDYYVIEDDNTYLRVVLKDLKPLIEKLNRDIVIEGTFDTSYTAGEMMEFSVTAESGKNVLKRSDWYVEACMDDYEDYEDFSDSFCDCSEEEYAEIKDCEFVYLLETDDGEILSGEVPMYEVKI